MLLAMEFAPGDSGLGWVCGYLAICLFVFVPVGGIGAWIKDLDWGWGYLLACLLWGPGGWFLIAIAPNKRLLQEQQQKDQIHLGAKVAQASPRYADELPGEPASLPARRAEDQAAAALYRAGGQSPGPRR